MSDSATELSCQQCPWSTVCNVEAMVEWLRRYGQLKRVEEPEPFVVADRSLTAEFHRIPSRLCNKNVMI